MIVLSLGWPLYPEGPLSKWSWKVGCRYIVLWRKPKSHCFPKTAQCAVRSDVCKTTACTTFSIISSPIPTKPVTAEQQIRGWTRNSLLNIYNLQPHCYIPALTSLNLKSCFFPQINSAFLVFI